MEILAFLVLGKTIKKKKSELRARLSLLELVGLGDSSCAEIPAVKA